MSIPRALAPGILALTFSEVRFDDSQCELFAEALGGLVGEDLAVANVDDAMRVFGDVGLVGDEHDGVALGVKVSNSAMISTPVLESRLPVGSSARMIEGLLTRARAMATRWRWPPESSFGLWFMRDSRPTLVSDSLARSMRSAAGVPL